LRIRTSNTITTPCTRSNYRGETVYFQNYVYFSVTAFTTFKSDLIGEMKAKGIMMETES